MDGISLIDIATQVMIGDTSTIRFLDNAEPFIMMVLADIGYDQLFWNS